jgi:hypothetical protein
MVGVLKLPEQVQQKIHTGCCGLHSGHRKVRVSEGLKVAYYDTQHWQEIREQRFKVDNYRCVACVDSCRDELQCHHFAYNIFNEQLDELLTVCRKHHEMIHENCLLKFPTGISLDHAERLLGGKEYPFEKWLLPE